MYKGHLENKDRLVIKENKWIKLKQVCFTSLLQTLNNFFV
jgi:hypothetical protein